MHIQPSPSPRPAYLFIAAVSWLLGGSVLLLTTLVPTHTALLGWSPAFWLFGAPLAVLLVLEPNLPRQLLMLSRARRRRIKHATWH